MSERDLITSLLNDMASAGIVPSKPSVIRFDTKDFVRFHVEGDKPSSKNGFWKGFSDGRPAGHFGSWKSSGFVAGHDWVYGDASTVTDEDIARIKAIQRQREAEHAAEHEKVSAVATAKFNKLSDATSTPYSERKMITPFNAKQSGTALVVALQNWDGRIWSVQTIFHDGTKRMLKGGRKKGCHIYIGGNPEGRLLICEGYATGCSLRQMDPDAEVIASVDAHNMRPVAESAREYFPQREIVLAGDHDPVGIRCAEMAARAIDGLILIPPEPETDWNDYAVANAQNLEVA